MDTNLDDEAAGRARHKLAAEASARRKEEKKRLVKENAEMKARLTAHRNTARTDDDVTDEASWQHRAELKKRSEDMLSMHPARLLQSLDVSGNGLGWQTCFLPNVAQFHAAASPCRLRGTAEKSSSIRSMRLRSCEKRIDRPQ